MDIKDSPSREKRGHNISLTAKGRMLKKHMPELIEKQMLKVLGGFDKKDKSSLIDVLGALRSVLGDEVEK